MNAIPERLLFNRSDPEWREQLKDYYQAQDRGKLILGWLYNHYNYNNNNNCYNNNNYNYNNNNYNYNNNYNNYYYYNNNNYNNNNYNNNNQ